MQQENLNGKVIKISDAIYPWAVELIDKYQKNYHGDDKMTREYMMGEIEKFKKEK